MIKVSMIFRKLIVTIIVLLPVLSYAQNSEIEHLLSFVKMTACQFERNGEIYTGEEALAHIRKKYDYYQDEIKTTEDFIKYSASKSKVSGKQYKIHCTGKAEITSEKWLLKELARFRANP